MEKYKKYFLPFGAIFLIAILFLSYRLMTKENSPMVSDDQICASEGARIGSCTDCVKKCCQNLEAMYPLKGTGGCLTDTPNGSEAICSQCGNGTCDDQNGENECNCQEDCRQQKVGGSCEYENYPGECQVISVSQDSDVTFVFRSYAEIDNPFSASLKNEHTYKSYELTNDSKYRIKQGDVSNCEVRLIETGTCTPMIFRFIPNKNPDQPIYCKSENDCKDQGFSCQEPNKVLCMGINLSNGQELDTPICSCLDPNKEY